MNSAYFTARLVALLVCLFLAAVTNAYANVSSETTVFRDSDGVIKWLRATGKPSVIKGYVASALGIGSGDVAVLERGMRVAGSKFTDVVAVRADADADLIIFARVDEDDGGGTVWRATRNGDLQAIVKLESGGATAVSATRQLEKEFESLKRYFNEKSNIQ